MLSVINLKNKIDMHLLTDYLNNKGTSCEENIMTKIEQEKRKIVQDHLDNVYPIKELYENGVLVGYYTKLTPKNRNHSGKISAKTIEDLELKIIARHLGFAQKSFTMEDILKAVVKDYYDNNQKPTGDTHRQNFERCFSNLKTVKVKDLTSEMIECELKRMIKTGIKAKAFNKAISTLNKIYDYCRRKRIPCIDIRTVIKDFRNYETKGKHVFIQDNRKSKNLAFTEQEAITIIKYALENPTYKSLFIALVLTTGCRAGELLCMAFDNISPDKNIFYVSEMEDAKTFEIHPYTKSNEAREVVLNRDAKRILEVLLDIRSKESNSSRFLFLNENSKDGKLHLRAVDDFLRDIQPKLGFDPTKEIRSLHDGRRTYASIQYLHGVDISIIKSQLGHTSIAQTEEYIKDIVEISQKTKELEKGCLNFTT